MYSFLNQRLKISMYTISSGFISCISKMIFENSPTSPVNEKRYGTVCRAQEAIMPVTKEDVHQLISSDTVVIFSKIRCPYCKLAKQIFDDLHKKYTAIELDERDDADEIQTILGEMTGARTVPRVFVKGVCLGGGTDVKKLYDNGELQKKL